MTNSTFSTFSTKITADTIRELYPDSHNLPTDEVHACEIWGTDYEQFYNDFARKTVSEIEKILDAEFPEEAGEDNAEMAYAFWAILN